MNIEHATKSKTIVIVRIGVAIVFSVLFSVSAQAQENLTLSKAINEAFLNRKNILAGKMDQEIRKLQTEALYRRFWPQLSAGYTYQYNPILQTSILPIGVFNPAYPADATKSVQFGTKWSQAAGLTLSQPLIDISVNRQIKEGKLQERIAAALQAQTEYELAATVAQAYFNILLQEAKIVSAASDTNRTWQSRLLLQNKFDQKRLLKSELNRGKINHNNAVQLYYNAVAQLIEDKVFLLFLIGRNKIEQTDIRLDTAYLNFETLQLPDVQPKVANIPELQQLQLKAELAGVQAKTERAKYLPTLWLKGYLGGNQYTNTFDPVAANSWFGLSYAGVELKYPLITGDDKKRKIEQMRMQSAQFNQQQEDRAAQYYKDAVVARIKLDRILNELKAQRENIGLGKEAVTIYQERVSEGQESVSALNLEEANLQKTETEYQKNTAQYLLYYLDYLKAAGKLEQLWK